MAYLIEKSIAKGVKYPVFIWAMGGLTTLLELVIAGLPVIAPDVADLTVLGILVFVYDLLKHGVGVKLP